MRRKVAPPRTNRRRQRQKNWLDGLEQDSWNLELIVSGVTIFLLLGGLPYLQQGLIKLEILRMGDSQIPQLMSMLYEFFGFSYFVLLTMFLLHLVLRGFWIASIGLRSVSGNFDLPSLGYHARYENWLRKRLGSFDDYVIKLERLSSVTFALAFLLFFAIISIGLFFVVMVGGILSIGYLLGLAGIEENDGPFALVMVVFSLSMLFGGLTYAIDFLTKGWLKKWRVFGTIYWPFYRFFGFITLAQLYRPLYYNVIDNALSRRLIGWYSLLTFLALIASGVTIRSELFFPHDASSDYMIHRGEYLDGTDPEDITYDRPGLSSMYATDDYLEVFAPYNDEYGDLIRHRYPNLSPRHDYLFQFKNVSVNEDDINVDSLYQAFQESTRLRVGDSLYPNDSWKFYRHPQRNQYGLVYQLPTYDLPRGEHRLITEQERYSSRRDSTYWDTTAIIYFYR